VVLRGSGRMKVDDEIVELKEWDAVRVPPRTSSARPISARIRAKTSMASATGGLTSRAVRKVPSLEVVSGKRNPVVG
jgi:hypothetical protein